MRLWVYREEPDRTIESAERKIDGEMDDLESGNFDARIVIAPLALLALLAVIAGLLMIRSRGR